MSGQRTIDFLPLDIQPGLFTLNTPAGSVRRWRDGLNVRWDDGLPQKTGGFIQRALTDQGGALVNYQGKARAYHQWESLDNQSWIAFGTACRLYLIGGDVLYDITPLRRQVYLTDPLTTTNGSSIVTVTDPSHDAVRGDHVEIEGGSAVGGLTISGEYDVVEVIDADTYTIDAGEAATSGATGGGSMTFRYLINCGLESDGFLYGYGVGDYGEEYYGTPRSTSSYRGYARIWSLDNWGEDLIASPNGDTLYVWRRQTGPQSRATQIVGAPANIERMLVGPDNLHVIALGANLASTGVQDKMFVRWCVANDYSDWLLTGENDAGSKRLDVGSRLITAVKTNRQIAIWSDKALYMASCVGGQQVYDIIMVASSPPLVSANAAVDVDGVVVAMTDKNFYIYDGTYRVMPCDIRNLVYGDQEYPGINRAQMSKVTCRLRRAFNEIRWSVPYGSSSENSLDVIYNYEQKCWYVSSIAREAGGDVTPDYGYAPGLSDGCLWLEEYGVDAYNANDPSAVAISTKLKSWEGQIANGSFQTEITELLPDFQWLYGSMDITVFGRNYPKEPESFGPTETITLDTDKLNPRFKRRQLGFMIETNEVGNDWRMGTWRGKYMPHGR
jgi:hypothetical protein